MRSLLLVPVAEAAAVEAALASEADALVLDLGAEPDARRAARHAALTLLTTTQWSAHRPHLFVRLPPLGEPAIDQDLAAVMPGEPDGVLLSTITGADVQHLGAKLAVHEAEYGLADGEVGIIAEAGGSARSVLGLGSYVDASSRLVGLTWHAEDLAADLGSDSDTWRSVDFAPFGTVRHLTLLAARAAAVAAIDTASGARTPEHFLAECRLARQQGFNAKLAWTPDQVTVINDVFGIADG